MVLGGGTLSYKGEVMSGVSALIKETPELPCPYHNVRLQLKDSDLWTRKCALTTQQTCQCLDLGLPDCLTVRNKLGIYKSPSL